MTFHLEPMTPAEQDRYDSIKPGSNAYHKSHGAGVIVTKDDKYATVEFINSVSSANGSRSFRALLEGDENNRVGEKSQTMILKVPAKVLVDEYGSWKITDEFGRDLLKQFTSFLESEPVKVNFESIPDPIPVGDFSRRIKELRSVNYNDTRALMENVAQCLDYTAFTWAREISRSPVETKKQAYQEALAHLGKDAWLNIFHVFGKNTDSERRVIESMLINITNKAAEDISDFEKRQKVAKKITASIEKRTAEILRAYIEEQFEIAQQEAEELERAELSA